MPKHVALTKPVDLSAPGAIDQLLAFHRQTFGGIRMEAEGGEGAPAVPAAPPAPAPAAPATPPAAPATTPPAAAPPAADSEGKVEDLPQWAQKALADARADAGKARTTAKQQAADAARAELLTQIAPALKALGVDVPGGEQVTPEQLAQKLADEAAARKASDETTQSIQREHQVLLSAIEAGADHKRLLDSRSFLAKVATLDPTAEDFPSKVDEAVKAALTADPKLKAARAAGASSVDHAGGSGEQVVRTPKPLDQSVAGHYGG